MPKLRLENLKASIVPVLLKSKSQERSEGRFLIRLDGDVFDMQIAQQVADTIFSILVVLIPEGLVSYGINTLPVAPLPTNILANGEIYSIYREDILSLDSREPIWDYFGDEVALSMSLGQALHLFRSEYEIIWQFAPVFTNPRLQRAASFLFNSFQESPAILYDKDIENDFIELTPQTTVEQAKYENAFQQAYKAIEVLLGGPISKNDPQRLRKRLVEAGFQPDSVTRNNKSLIEAIMEFQKIRDRRAAHGKVYVEAPNLREILDIQHLVTYMIIEFAKVSLPDQTSG